MGDRPLTHLEKALHPFPWARQAPAHRKRSGSLTSLAAQINESTRLLQEGWETVVTLRRSLGMELGWQDDVRIQNKLVINGVPPDGKLSNLSKIVRKHHQSQQAIKEAWTSGGRRWIYGFPIAYPPPNSEDCYLALGNEESRYLVEAYHKYRFLVYTDSVPLLVQIPERGGHWYMVQEGDVFQPRLEEWAKTGQTARKRKAEGSYNEPFKEAIIRWSDDPQGGVSRAMRLSEPRPKQKCCRWETPLEFAARQKRDRKECEGYIGNHNWTPPDAYSGPEHRQRRRKMIYACLDIRRLGALVLGIWMLCIHCGLLS